MIRDIMRDEKFLAQKSTPATAADLTVAQDLLDTLVAHAHECVGMAANMIGVRKNIIVINVGLLNIAMLNPVLKKKSGRYIAEEGCLSLTGTRKCVRYKEITVEYQDMELKKQRQSFSDWSAQIVQHELDHLQGIII